jgi:hypothetical protein
MLPASPKRITSERKKAKGMSIKKRLNCIQFQSSSSRRMSSVYNTVFNSHGNKNFRLSISHFVLSRVCTAVNFWTMNDDDKNCTPKNSREKKLIPTQISGVKSRRCEGMQKVLLLLRREK